MASLSSPNQSNSQWIHPLEALRCRSVRHPIAIELGTDTTAWGVVVPDLPISLPCRVLHRLNGNAKRSGETHSGFNRPHGDRGQGARLAPRFSMS